MSTPAQLLPVIAPEFTGDQSAAIAVAEMQIAPGLCRDKRPLLVAYLTAHILTIARRTNGAAGPVSSLTEGKLSVGFSGGSVTGSLGQTSYGQEFDRLSRGCVFAARTRIDVPGVSCG